MMLQNIEDHWSTSIKMFTSVMGLTGTVAEYREASVWKLNGLRSIPLVKILMYSASCKNSGCMNKSGFSVEIHKGAAVVAILINSSLADITIWEIMFMSAVPVAGTGIEQRRLFVGLCVEEGWAVFDMRFWTSFLMRAFALGPMTGEIW
jgi:hypothetical protein